MALFIPVRIVATEPALTETSELLSAFGLNPDAVITNVLPVLSSTNSPVEVTADGFMMTLNWISSGLDDAIRPADRIRVFATENPSTSVCLGEAYLFSTETNRLADMAFPLANNSMSSGMMRRIWSPVSDVSGVCLRGTPTNMPPTRVFLARRGAVCILKSTTVTNLIELAEIICDTLSPPAEE